MITHNIPFAHRELTSQKVVKPWINMLFLSFVFLLHSLVLGGQGLHFEKGYNDDYNQLPKAVVCDGTYSYLAFQQYTSTWFTYFKIIKLDTEGNEIWSQNLPQIGETMDIDNMWVAEDGGVFVAGSSYVTCDVIGNILFTMKLDANGNLEWQNESAAPSGEFVTGFSKTAAQTLIHLENSNPTSQVKITSLDGQIIDSIAIDMNSIRGFEVIGDYSFVGHNGIILYAFDDTGAIVDSLESTSLIHQLLTYNDMLYMVTEENVTIINSDLTVQEEVEIAGFSGFSRLKLSDNSIRLLSHNDILSVTTLLTLNSQWEVVNAIEFQESSDNYKFHDYSEDHFVHALPFLLTEFRSIRYFDYALDTEESAEVPTTDIALVNLVANDVVIANGFTPGTYHTDVDISVEVKNNGNVMLHSFRLNKFLFPTECSPAYFSEEYEDMNIAPGESVWIDLGLVYNGTAYLPQGESQLEVNYCVYSSHPNKVTDLNIDNDEACGVTMVEITGVAEHFQKQLSLYPNPVVDVLHVDLWKDVNPAFEVVNTIGEVVMTGQIRNGQVSLATLPKGIYFIKISEQESQDAMVSRFVKM